MSKIVKIVPYNGTGPEDGFDFGATFDNVTCDWEEDGITKFFTLKQLYDYLKNFFNDGTFVMYSEKEPKNSNVKVWYDTTEKTIIE